MTIGRILLSVVCLLAYVWPVSAEDMPEHPAYPPAEYTPTRYGVGLLVGKAYDPDQFGMIIIQGQMLVDYDRIFWHSAPDSLALKLEANAGITTDGRDLGLVSIDALAHYYLEHWRSKILVPYIEAGVGLIYTSFKVEGQGLHFNFNPQAGAGVEFATPGGQAVTVSVRFHHLSNGNTYKDNRGVNSAFLMLGYLF